MWVLTSSFLFCGAGAAQDSGKSARAAESGLTGRWIVNSDFYGTTLYFGVELEQKDNKLTGNFDGDKLEGTLTGNAIHFVAKDEHGGTEEVSGTTSGAGFSGSVIFTDGSDPKHPETHTFAATRVPEKRAGAAQRHEFVPTTFYRRFSAENKPVLTVSPGDTIHTTTVDAGGTDEKGVTRVLGGKPATGPVYVQSCVPGD